jgi:phage-related protein
MFDLIARISSIITGDINAVKNWIIKLIQSVYSFISRELDLLGHDISNVWNDLYGFILTVEHFALNTYNTLYGYVVNGLKSVISWAGNEINKLASWVHTAYETVVGWIDDVRKEIDALSSALVKWVLQHIWDPLYNFVAQALHWIEHEGAYIYDLITHPDKLVTLLGHYLWISWLGLTKAHAKPIAHWFLHTMLSIAGEFADVLETIIAAMM